MYGGIPQAGTNAKKTTRIREGIWMEKKRKDIKVKGLFSDHPLSTNQVQML